MAGTTPILRLGTRASPLALAQAEIVRLALARAHGWPEAPEECPVEIVSMTTTGDQIQSRALLDIGGKGLFTKELEEALNAQAVDIAVHSMKDVPTVLPDGLEIAVILEREDPRDVFIGRTVDHPDDLPPGVRVGTSSLRRQAQLLVRRPDLEIVPLRGNVQTRLRKVAEGEVEGTFLAQAGLNRLGLHPECSQALASQCMLPAPAQGAVGIEIRAGDAKTYDLIAPLNHRPTAARVAAERAFMKVLDGSCRTPIAGHAQILHDGALQMEGRFLTPDGMQYWEAKRTGPAAEAVAIGRAVGEDIRAQQAAGTRAPKPDVVARI